MKNLYQIGRQGCHPHPDPLPEGEGIFDPGGLCLLIWDSIYEDCLLNIETLWIDRDMLPLSRSYVTMELRVGGAEARLTKPGWASYRQVWPRVAGAVSGAPVTSGEFDVSEVDMTNLPDVDCREPVNATQDHSCGDWHEFPDLGIAGFRSGSRTEGEYRMVYVQVKALPGEGVDAEAVIDTMVERYPRTRKEDYVIIPVKYDYGELWRWA